MSGEPSASIQPQQQQFSQNNHNRENTSSNNGSSNHIAKKQRPSRACTARAAARLYEAAAAEAAVAVAVRKKKKKKKAKKEQLGLEKSPEPSSPPPSPQCKIITQLVGEPLPLQLPRWSLRSMSELASILNFLNIFRPLLNIKVEFSAEELETALIAPNNTLATIHVPLLKAIPPITRTALGHKTWITVLCRKLRDWWHWVAEGDLPIVASHGAEIEAYNALDPGVRVLILKALCDIRVEQEDIRTHIDDSIKDGAQLSAFRKACIGGDSYGVSYWYEDDPLIGHRLYREIRKVEVKEVKGKHAHPIPSSSYQWETVATNLDEFEDVSEKLFSSENRTETSLGKKLKIDMLPEIEKVHKRKEKLLKKQHRQALLLENMMNLDGFAPGRSLRDRKPVTYTFDEYDRSINEAIKITKQKQPSPEPSDRRESTARPDASINVGCIGDSQIHLQNSFNAPSPKSFDFDDYDMDHKPELLHRSDRQRQRPQRYSAKEFVQAISDNDADFGSDDDIVGEAVFDEDYTRQRKQRKTSSSSEGDEEYHWDEENAEDEQLEEDDDSLSASEDSDDGPRRLKKLPAGRTRRETKLLSVDCLQSGLRRSKRATKNGINYKQLELSESEADSMKPEKSHVSDEHTDSDNAEFSMESQESEGNNDGNHQIREVDQPETVQKVENQPLEKSSSTGEKEIGGLRKTRFLDLNELAPGSGFEDGPNAIKYEDTDDI